MVILILTGLNRYSSFSLIVRLGRDALAAILRDRMTEAIDEHMDRMALLNEPNLRNGCYRGH